MYFFASISITVNNTLIFIIIINVLPLIPVAHIYYIIILYYIIIYYIVYVLVIILSDVLFKWSSFGRYS